MYGGFLARFVVAILILASLTVGAAQEEGLTDDQMQQAQDLYFDLCSGCHGPTRTGATGPEITPETLEQKGIAYLEAILFQGLPGGMPDWGRQGVLNEDEIELMAEFLLAPVPDPPLLGFDEIMDSWNLITPVADRPTEPQTDRDWENYMGVILRDVGQVAILDSDTKELVTILETGYATHILRSSKDGRYYLAVGRDGKASLIDLWTETPEVVAETRPCVDARSIESSKMDGYLNTYVVEGCYWPPHFVIMDGLTLEPLKVVSTVSYARGTGERVDAARVAAIVASEFNPEWIVNIKEAGQTWLVDYSRLEEDGRPLEVTMLDTELFLHDGGWARGRYFIVAANNVNKLVVIDTEDRAVEATVDVGIRPHPGRGANWTHPEYGPVWATGNLGSPEMTVIGADPDEHPDHAWEVVKQVELPYTGNLFIKTHPNSPYVIADFALSSHPDGPSTLCAIDTQTLGIHSCWQVPDAKENNARMVHIEYNREGTEFWVSAWAPLTSESFIVVYDTQTLEETARITGDWVQTPTGKFNVYNTAHDVY